MAEVMIAGAVGGREHALGLALEGNGLTFTHGGNAGTQVLGENLKFGDGDYGAIADYAAGRSLDLVIIGPETPLVAGLADKLRIRGVPTFGPGSDGAQLEASKAFSAVFNQEYGIRQPDFEVANNWVEAVDYLRAHSFADFVIKADGLAGGKGVILPNSQEEAIAAVSQMINGRILDGAGKRIVFQRRLDAFGPEISGLYVFDGRNFCLLPLSQDHKRLRNNDEGPNTGGMGAYTPLPFASNERVDELLAMGEQLADGFQRRAINYRGLVYLGAMEDVEQNNNLSVLEINVRFGDPETQVVLASLAKAGVDVHELLDMAANGCLDRSLRGKYLDSAIGGSALTVCLAAEGYPEKPIKDRPIEGLDRDYEGVTIHHGGTKFIADRVVNSGGRSLYVTAVGDTIDQAASRAYAAIGNDAIHFEGMQYRTDIAWQARTAV